MSIPPRLRLVWPAIAPVRTSVRHRPNGLEATIGSALRVRQPSRRSLGTTSGSRREDVRLERYGKANAPPPHIVAALDIAKEEAKTRDRDTRKAKEAVAQDTEDKKQELDSAKSAWSNDKSIPTKQEAKGGDESALQSPAPADAAAKSPVPNESDNTVAAILADSSSVPSPSAPEAKEATPSPTKDTAPNLVSETVKNPPELSKLDETIKPPAYLDLAPANPLQKVLQLPAPDSISEADRPPHLQPPPYVHHFNSYALVKELASGNFTDTQSVSIMKAVRGLLGEHLDLARRGLVSKSNIENETYLFRAACSELRTEVGAMRRTEAESMRAQRAQLQHEVDILGQRISQDTSNMKDDLKGLSDDRKMALRMELRNTDGRIQELNYKIQTVLNSDSRTEVEGIRWVLTRRAGMALAITVVMVLLTLNYSRYMTQTQERERKKHAKDMAAMRDVGTGPVAEMMSMGTQTEPPTSGEEALVAGAGVTLG